MLHMRVSDFTRILFTRNFVGQGIFSSQLAPRKILKFLGGLAKWVQEMHNFLLRCDQMSRRICSYVPCLLIVQPRKIYFLPRFDFGRQK